MHFKAIIVGASGSASRRPLAAYKTVREYRALEVADHRQKIEEKIRALVLEQLQQEKLDAQLQVTVIQVRNALPNAEILQSATQYVKAQNELRIKETEVAIARKESERMMALAQNSAQSIEYMNAQARLKIAEGVQSGKVQAIVVPYDFKGFVHVGNGGHK
jgi:hypothetical protein